MERNYTKNSITVKAVQFLDSNKDQVLNWAASIQMNVYASRDENQNPIIKIPTLEGEMECALNDFIIVEPFPTDWRKLYPCKPEIFHQTYKPVESSNTPTLGEETKFTLKMCAKCYCMTNHLPNGSCGKCGSKEVFFPSTLESVEGKPIEIEVGSECMYCGEVVPGAVPKYCCNGSNCGCMGLPIEPIVCSKGCYEMLMNKHKQPSVESVEEAAEKNLTQLDVSLQGYWNANSSTERTEIVEEAFKRLSQSNKQEQELEEEVRELMEALDKFTYLNPEYYKDIAGLIYNAKNVLSKHNNKNTYNQ